MLRYLRYVVILSFGLALLLVALANRAPVTVRLMPDDIAAFAGLDWQMQVPLFIVMFGGIVAGLLIGFILEWLREMKHRSTASTKSREVARLERELAVLRDQKAAPQDDVLALLDRPKAKG